MAERTGGRDVGCAFESWLPGADGVELSVGVLAADLLNLGRDLERLSRSGVRAAHFDVMDGRFCPELTIGHWFVKATTTELVKDVHLLVADPENWVTPCVLAGAGVITVHVETETARRALDLVSEAAGEHQTRAPLRGAAICPETPARTLEPLLDVIDVVYVLGIHPGVREPLLSTTPARVGEIRDVVAQTDRQIRLAVDGGVTLDNFAEIAALRPDLVVSGSAVFADDDVEGNLEVLAQAGAGLGRPRRRGVRESPTEPDAT